MNQSYRKMNYKEQKSRQYPLKSNYKCNRNGLFKKISKQIIVCIIVVIVAILIKNVHSPITNKTTEIIKTSLTKEMDMKKSIKQIVKYAKEVPQIPNKVVSVFHTFSDEKMNMEFIIPIKGDIISNYGENIDPFSDTKTFQRGVDILVNTDKNIVTVADGEVIEIGEGKSLGKYIKVKHNNDIASLYANCIGINVKKGQKVKKGEKIGIIHKLEDNKPVFLHFELWVEGKVVDPIKYIPFDRKIL